MSATSDVITVNVAVSASGPTRAGFGEPLIAAYHTHYTDLVREYNSLAGLVADGFATTEPAYLCAAAILAANPTVTAFKVGRRALAFTQVLTLTLTSTATTDTYSMQVGLPGTTPTKVTLASTGVPATDATSLAAAISALALSGLTVTHASAVVTLTMTAGKMLDLYPDIAHTTLAETTTDPGLATDLNVILAADSNWYGLLLDNQSPAEITAGAAWALSNTKLFIANSSESGIMNPASTTDIAYTTGNSSNSYFAGVLSAAHVMSYRAARWMATLFPTDPGSENWAFKTLAGDTADNITISQIHAAENKRWNTYISMLGLPLTRFGTTCSTAVPFIDIRRGVDWLSNGIQVAVVGVLANNNKLPYTDKGVLVLVGAIYGVLTQGVQKNFLAGTPAPVVTAPLVATINSTNRIARNIPNISATANLAGAVNSVVFNIVLSS